MTWRVALSPGVPLPVVAAGTGNAAQRNSKGWHDGDTSCRPRFAWTRLACGVCLGSRFLITVSDARPKINPDLTDVATGVHEEFDERLDPLVVDECLTRVAAKFDQAKVRSFVPLLVRRYVHDELNEVLDCA